MSSYAISHFTGYARDPETGRREPDGTLCCLSGWAKRYSTDPTCADCQRRARLMRAFRRANPRLTR